MNSEKLGTDILSIDSANLDVGITYPYSFVELSNGGQCVGKLIINEKGGKLHFEGDVEKSAQIFFDEIIKKYAEAYL